MDNIEQQGWRNLFRTDRAKIDTDMGSLTFSFYDILEMLSTRRKPLSALDIAKGNPKQNYNLWLDRFLEPVPRL